jgi:dienelactone hydrolase
MTWKPELTAALLEGRACDYMKSFLLGEIPPFEAPTDAKNWPARARGLRKAALEKVYLRGYPAAVVKAKPKVVWGEALQPAPEYVVRKLRYECYPGYWIPALLYEPTKPPGAMPVMLNPEGHCPGGNAAAFKQIRCANLARRGVLALSMEFTGMGELEAERHGFQALLNVTGMAGVGIFYLALQKGLDVLLQHPKADPARVGVTGLSGGGWQTIVISALDARVTLSVPVAGYTSMQGRVECHLPNDIGDLEQCPPDLTTVIDYQPMTAMVAPHPMLQILNEHDDCCFRTDRTRPVIYDALLPTWEAFGAAERFQTHNNFDPGTHNYEADNRAALYRFLSEQWGIPGPARDTHRKAEVLPEARLRVGLPPDQETFQTLAVRRARRLARERKVPRTAAERQELRRRLRDVLRLPEFTAQAPAGFGTRGGVVEIGPWRVPVSVSRQAGAEGTELIICDGGRGSAWTPPAGHPPAERRFFADILGTGETACGWQAEMLVESIGHRVLGHQVAQTLALARAAAGDTRVRLVSNGTRTGVVALLAAGLEPSLFESLTCYANLGSLATLIECMERYETLPALYCFGLLEVADLPELAALLEGVVYRQPSRSVAEVRGGRVV